MSKEQIQEAIIQISNIIDQWTSMNLDANDALELLEPLLRTVITYFDLDPTGDEKKSLYEDLEKGLEEEKLEDLETYDPGLDKEQEDLFPKNKEEEEEKT